MNKPALLQLLLAMAIFGSIGFFSRHAGLPALELVFARCLCAIALLSAAWVLSGSFGRERWSAKETLLIAACGVTNVLNWIFLFKSFELISVTIAISLYHLAPVLVLLAGSFLFRDRLKTGSVVALAGCFAGTLLLMGADGFRASAPDWRGMLYAVAAAFFYAATMLLGRSVRRTSVYATTLIQMMIGALALLPFVRFASYSGLDPSQWRFAVLTGVIHTGFVYLLFFRSIRHLPSAAVSLLVFVDPAVAILLDVGVTGFRPDPLQTAGILLLFGSLIGALARPLLRKERRGGTGVPLEGDRP
ncbi:DMT family transporter [Paenibacillus sp. MWE-103]|uniref:DMT family transporter n=1 Tax=Paenibacillus artemisiicola TaxID=1172618 RepID=A0ABS3W302_9BACL|nr:DMT family transporter [Paenibacillus artemisiicola]MBO7742682.1 DMT family transporter [Paenibacillus artemisiicola]